MFSSISRFINYLYCSILVVIYCTKKWIKFFRNQIGLCFIFKLKITPFYLLLVFIFFYHIFYSLSRIIIFCYSVIRCHSLLLVATRCTTRCHSLWLVVPLVGIRPLVVILFHSLYHSFSLDVNRCHSICLFFIKGHAQPCIMLH